MSASDERTRWQTYVERRLDEIAALESDWDSYGSLPVSRGAIDQARIFLGAVEVLRLAFPEITCPSIVPTSDGGVDLEWLPKSGAWASVEFTTDGRVEAIGHDQGKTVELSRGYEDEPAGVAVPTEPPRCVCSANYLGPSKHSDACRTQPVGLPAVPEEKRP